MRSNQQGFTIPELLAAMVVMLALCIGSYYLLHPTDYGPEQRDAKRRTAVAQLADALVGYYAANGQLPSAVVAQKKIISSDKKTGSNICADLVPTYMKDLPFDPTLNVKSVKGTCAAKNQQYVTSYLISRTEDGKRFTISAPLHEGAPITITRQLGDTQN